MICQTCEGNGVFPIRDRDGHHTGIRQCPACYGTGTLTYEREVVRLRAELAKSEDERKRLRDALMALAAHTTFHYYVRPEVAVVGSERNTEVWRQVYAALGLEEDAATQKGE